MRFYITRCDATSGLRCFAEKPERVLFLKDGSILWDGRQEAALHGIEKFIPGLDVKDGRCVEVDDSATTERMICLIVVDVTDLCKLSYH